MRKNVLILLFALIASSFCFGQQNFFKNLDSFVAAKYLAVDSKGWLYIATSNGLFVMKGMDGDIVKTNLSYQNIIRVEVNERDDVFAIPLGENKLYYSRDGGDTWTETQLPTPFSSKSAKADASKQDVKTFNDSNIQSFFAKGDKILCGGENIGGIWKSEDLGASWNKVWEVPIGTLGVNVIYERSNGDFLAGTSSVIIVKNNKQKTEDYGIFRSTDGGSSWSYWKPNYGRPDFVCDIVENSEKHLFLGSSFYFPDLNGIYVSNDDGNTWKHSFHDPSGWNIDFAIAPNDVIYAFLDGNSPEKRSLVRSFDGGVSWKRIHYYIDNLNDRLRSLCVSSDGYLYALSPFNLVRSRYPVTGTTCNVTATVSPEDAGTIVGNGSYHANETVLLIAKAKTGYEFANWSLADGTIITENPEYSFQITEDVNIIANFRYNSAINELAGKAISVYPNPFTEKLQIDGLASDRATISISDIQGREVYRGIYMGDAINLSHLLRGVYILNVKADGKSGAYKIVKSMSN